MPTVKKIDGQMPNGGTAYFTATHDMTYGCWICPECKAEFYGGGKALHKSDCVVNDYTKVDYFFGPNESEALSPLLDEFWIH